MMKRSSKQITRIADLLEQIQAVDEMIELHKEDENDLMLSQYRHRKSLFLKEFVTLLKQMNIDLTEALV